MIDTKHKLNNILRLEKKIYDENLLEKKMTGDRYIYISRYIKFLRKEEYYHNRKKKIMYIFYRRKKNKLGIKLGFEIWDNVFDEGLTIFHAGNIIVNGNSRIGKNCKLHGNNCIGNNGISEKCPRIGNNVDIGFGAIIIGDILIADNIKIGAGAVVVSSFTEPGITIAGVPAKKVK